MAHAPVVDEQPAGEGGMEGVRGTVLLRIDWGEGRGGAQALREEISRSAASQQLPNNKFCIMQPRCTMLELPSFKAYGF